MMNKMTYDQKIDDEPRKRSHSFNRVQRVTSVKENLLRLNNCLSMSHLNILKMILVDAVFHPALNGYVFRFIMQEC